MPEFAYGSGPPQPVKPMKPEQVAEGVTIVRPLSRKGTGPGLIVLVPYSDSETPLEIEDGIPSPRMKWAEEGYCVAEIRPHASSNALKTAVTKLLETHECSPKEKMGLICYDPDLFLKSASTLESLKDTIIVATIYAEASSHPHLAASTSIPTLYHLPSPSPPSPRPSPNSKIYTYSSTPSHLFALPFTPHFHSPTESLSHTRTLTFLKHHLHAPLFDLELLWDEHTHYEFIDRNVQSTMNTMVQEPYVNHIPTLTGGIGRAALTDFYTHHFIFSNPDDTELELISRTVGVDRVVDEFIYKFTHDRTPDWLFPGIPPTFRKVEIPMMAVVCFRGDRLYHEHISWDQASALRQIGVLGERGRVRVQGEDWEVVLPVAGTETVCKMRDRNGVLSNRMFGFEARRVG